MNNLNVTANKIFFHGFVLREQDLRRFVELIVEQMRKENSGNVEFNFSLMYENGIVGQTIDLEEILSQENSGSSKITELSLNFKSENDRVILLEFANVNSKSASTNISIKYRIISKSRDWAFITSSMLDERILKVKRISLNSPGNSTIFRKLIIPNIAIFVPVSILLMSLIFSISKSESKMEIIKNNWKNGILTDPIEALIRIQEVNNTIIQFDGLKYSIYGISLSILCLWFIVIYFQNVFPTYNFLWGDYVNVFNKKESTRKTINIVIILGLIVSVVAGIIVNYIIN
ncbi:hypothetical protein IX49_06550 [Cellulophaga lytica]|uniref:hypothetical protein n=1 Tax=Cellulophaga lytica TaxID=979 RepID=UPI0004F58A15|nr:hypothetical protein [Cellulophaga lytica]AIM60196.1 hypothetical protein IX49_06550 [Cellulophaga lytica]